MIDDGENDLEKVFDMRGVMQKVTRVVQQSQLLVEETTVVREDQPESQGFQAFHVGWHAEKLEVTVGCVRMSQSRAQTS